MADRPFVSALVLAAGRGSRMGRTKQLLSLDGRAVLAHVIAAARGAAVDEVVVVLGHDAPAIRAALGEVDGVRFVENPAFDRGQAESLSIGLAALDERSRAAVVLLGDQPTVRSGDVDRVVAAFLASDAPAARAIYGEGQGEVARHPTVLGRELWDEVRAEEGDVGARRVLERHAKRVLRVRSGDEAPPDLDTPADFDALTRRSGR